MFSNNCCSQGGAAGLVSLQNECSSLIINLAEAGDEIVSPQLYGGTNTQFNDILPKLGINVKFVDPNNPENFAAAITDKTKAICETVVIQTRCCRPKEW